jgi:hypothetical protein
MSILTFFGNLGEIQEKSIKLKNSEKFGYCRILAGSEKYTSTFKGICPSYKLTFPIKQQDVPFDVITNIKVTSMSQRVCSYDPSFKWIDRLYRMEILADDHIIATSEKELAECSDDLQTFSFDLLLPFSGFSRFQEISIRLIVEVNMDIKLGYVLSASPWLDVGRHFLEIEGQMVDTEKSNKFFWIKDREFTYAK